MLIFIEVINQAQSDLCIVIKTPLNKSVLLSVASFSLGLVSISKYVKKKPFNITLDVSMSVFQCNEISKQYFCGFLVQSCCMSSEYSKTSHIDHFYASLFCIFYILAQIPIMKKSKISPFVFHKSKKVT